MLKLFLILALGFATAATYANTVGGTDNSAEGKVAQYQAGMDAAIAMLLSNEPHAVSHFVDSQLHSDVLQSFGGDGRERYIGYLSAEKRFHGAFTLLSLQPMTPEQRYYEAKLRSHNTELDYTLRLGFSAEAPFKVSTISLNYRTGAADKALARLSQQQVVSELAGYIDRLAGRGLFSGTVLLADQQGVLYQTAKGMANLRYQVKNNTDTKFNLASMNKMFTAVSVLQLVAEKKLALEDKLIKYLDRELFAAGDFDNITIAQLLTHTAGLGWPSYPDMSQNKLRNLNDHRPFLKHLPLNSPPGSRFSYSNEGMLLLGMVVEAVSGKSYDDYVQQHIYAKAGMPNSGNFDIDGVTPNMAMGYFYSQQLQSMQTNWFMHAIKGSPAGGGYSTINDLYQFATALTQYQLLPKALTEAAYSAKPELNSAWYGYGFSVQTNSHGRVVGHSGDFIGVSSAMRIYLDKGYTLIVLANRDFASEPVVAMAETLLGRL
ncbi:serine hydrolase domain-containing protein [Rheinheimera maricola]|uniref:Beta-lactamase family protein n=1 Tax=Rheinheimera maricola TaxID=2793282 RepID=A0ABS7X9Q5_9GAMM|nr:serine hydrolase domain-containing protein [Rheinheimera maricola]MBZ9612289.1 beta-lactamase family protein [Rheinheimera maricola]